MSNPIQIPNRILASSRPPQPNDIPPTHSPPKFSPIYASSFDKYCGHMQNVESFRNYWKKSVTDYKNVQKKKENIENIGKNKLNDEHNQSFIIKSNTPSI